MHNWMKMENEKKEKLALEAWIDGKCGLLIKLFTFVVHPN